MAKHIYLEITIGPLINVIGAGKIIVIASYNIFL